MKKLLTIAFVLIAGCCALMATTEQQNPLHSMNTVLNLKSLSGETSIGVVAATDKSSKPLGDNFNYNSDISSITTSGTMNFALDTTEKDYRGYFFIWWKFPATATYPTITITGSALKNENATSSIGIESELADNVHAVGGVTLSNTTDELATLATTKEGTSTPVTLKFTGTATQFGIAGYVPYTLVAVQDDVMAATPNLEYTGTVTLNVVQN